MHLMKKEGKKTQLEILEQLNCNLQNCDKLYTLGGKTSCSTHGEKAHLPAQRTIQPKTSLAFKLDMSFQFQPTIEL